MLLQALQECDKTKENNSMVTTEKVGITKTPSSKQSLLSLSGIK